MADPTKYNDRPLWLPAGSVRAIIALLITGVICYGAVVQLAAGKEIPEAVAALAGMIITYYFVKKLTENK